MKFKNFLAHVSKNHNSLANVRFELKNNNNNNNNNPYLLVSDFLCGLSFSLSSNLSLASLATPPNSTSLYAWSFCFWIKFKQNY